MQQLEQATEAILGCASALKTVGIRPDRAVIALRLDDSQFAVTAPDFDLNASDQSRIFFLDKEHFIKRYPLPSAVFEANCELHAFIRTYPHFSSIAATFDEPIPPVLDDMAQIVGVYAHACKAEDQHALVRMLKKHCACFIDSGTAAERGAISVGRSLNQAFAATLVLEKAAQVHLQSQFLGEEKPIGLPEAVVMHFGYQFKYSRKNETVRHRTAADFDRTIDENELALRRGIVELGKQLSQENLVQGTWGNISARLDEGRMLCTPSGIDYTSITPYDIVRVELGTLHYEGGIKPTSEKGFHAALLRAHPDINCVIHTHPVSCSVFAAAHERIRPQDKAQRELLCGDVEVAKYGFPGTKKLCRNVVAAIGNNRACIMENHGMLVCGSSLEDAHEKCHAAEECARLELDRLITQHDCPDIRSSVPSREQTKNEKNQ